MEGSDENNSRAGLLRMSKRQQLIDFLTASQSTVDSELNWDNLVDSVVDALLVRFAEQSRPERERFLAQRLKDFKQTQHGIFNDAVECNI